jgi:hypothetical protein
MWKIAISGKPLLPVVPDIEDFTVHDHAISLSRNAWLHSNMGSVSFHTVLYVTVAQLFGWSLTTT